MASNAKPWEQDTTSDTEAQETDKLLGKDQKLDRQVSGGDDYCDVTLGGKVFVTNLNEQFGPKLLWLLFAAQFLIKGFATSFIGKAEPYLYKSYHVTAASMQIYQGVTQLPWAIKPIIGLMSDMYPIMGYNKAPYMFVTSIGGILSYVLVGISSPASVGIAIIVVCFILIQLQASASDLLSEAKYSERIREIPAHGPALLSYVWFGMTVGTLCAALAGGIAISRFGPQHVYLLATIPAASIMVPLFLNYLQESPRSEEDVLEERQKYLEQWELIILSVIMFVSAILLMFVGLAHSGSTKITAITAIIVAIVVLIGFSVLLSPTIAKFNAFSLIQTSMSFGIGGSAFYFYTDTKEEYPEGPHFSPFFYNSVLGVVSSLVSLFGIYCYQRWMSTWNYQRILITTNIAYSIICLPDMMLFMRANLKFGIPDHVFLLGSSVAQNIIFQWQWMPQVVILAALCPKGKEATMFALLAGCHNLGNTIASNCGALLLTWLDCAPRGAPNESAQFDNLWKASLITTILPLFTVAMIPWLVPNARQVDQLLDDSDDSATKGSLYRRWTGRE